MGDYTFPLYGMFGTKGEGGREEESRRGRGRGGSSN